MSKTTSNNASSGISLCSLVFLVFLVLKLAGIGEVANWSWWWVTSPLWLPIGVVLAVLLVFGFIMILPVLFGNAKITMKETNKEGDKPFTFPKSKSIFQQRLEEMSKQRKKNEQEGTD